MPPRSDAVKAWLQQAAHDVRSAHILLEHESPVLGTAGFHRQQGVERGLKASMAWKVMPFDKGYSLSCFLALCERQDPGYDFIGEKADTLVPYAVEVPYP